MSANEMTIRPVHPDDAADLYALVTHTAVVPNILQLPYKMRRETDAWVRQADPNRHRLVAVINGRVAGSASLMLMGNPRLRHLGRLGIMVHPDVWGQGVGSALMAALMNLADNWFDLKRVELEVYTDNEPAIHLYKKFGFAIEGERHMAAYGNGRFQNDYVMARLRNLPPNRGDSPPPQPPRAPRPATIEVRPIDEADIPALHAMYNMPEVGRTTLQYPSQEISRSEQRYHGDFPGLYRYVAVGDGKVIGGASIHHYQNPRRMHSGGLGMMVHRHYWGMGIGTHLMDALLDLADNWLNLKRIDLEVNTDNPSAVRLYENFGFVIEGTKQLHTVGDGRWADSHFMARICD